MRREVEAIGTNAHELPMVYAALAEDDEALAAAPYRVLADWQEDYEGNLRIILPDTYGTEGFLDRAPDWLAHWTGIRIDSGDPIEGGELAIRWWRSRGQDPARKLAIFSDGLDVEMIERLHRHFSGRLRIGFGWGTLLTNDFRGLAPHGRARSVLDRVQGGGGQRPARRQAVRQSQQGRRPAGGDRALQARFRPHRDPGRAGRRVTAPFGLD